MVTEALTQVNGIQETSQNNDNKTIDSEIHNLQTQNSAKVLTLNDLKSSTLNDLKK